MAAAGLGLLLATAVSCQNHTGPTAYGQPTAPGKAAQASVRAVRAAAKNLALSDECRTKLAEAGLKLTEEQAFEPRLLRGYGAVQGQAYQWERAAARGSLLSIVCENPERAKLLQAKYLSDVSVLPGVADEKRRCGGQEIAVKTVQSQGTLAALRTGTRVHIFAASSPELLEALVTGCEPAGTYASTAETEVPMYLDLWDRFSLRFYHSVWMGPEGEKGKNYDPLQELQWAKNIGRAGLVLWTGSASPDLAVGLTDEPNWDWLLREAKALKLPVGLNTVTFNSASLPVWMNDQFQQRMPQCTANQYGIGDVYHAGAGTRLSWCAQEGLDYALGPIQQLVRRHVDNPSVAFYMEPHNEIRHRSWDILLEYGPPADRSYRQYLREKYQTAKAVSQRWHGDTQTLRSWEQVRVPEVASFQGWGPEALDLVGTWKVCFEPKEAATIGTTIAADSTAPQTWMTPDFDDSSWPDITVPGADRWYLLPKTPVVFRRTLQVPAEWVRGKPTWLYLWDLNQGNGKQSLVVYLNGKKIDETRELNGMGGHLGRYDVSDIVQAGTNHLAVRLPSGYLAYRAYLSHTPPTGYPSPDPQYNARWADFIGWYDWTRGEAVRRGLEAIRSADPNRPIEIAAPGSLCDSLRPLCEQYGALFYDTGSMSGFSNDILPMLMRGIDMPFALEPGAPAPDIMYLKSFLGLWATEGIQANNYFMHIGDVFYRDEIRNYFESQLALTRLTGKYHAPKAEVAILASQHQEMLSDFPMPEDPNVLRHGGYWAYGHGQMPSDRWHFDALIPADFKLGHAAAYKVIVDTNTTIMEPALVEAIAAWVRAGGVFITRIQTGRHTPERADAWPISKLTGYGVSRLDLVVPIAKGRQAGAVARSVPRRKIVLASGQSVFAADAWDMNNLFGSGQTLQKQDPACQDLLLWEDGGVAAGMRPLGQGLVVNLGVANDLPDVVAKILTWRKLTPLPVAVTPGPREAGIWPCHYLSNNGLYEVWRVWNQKREGSEAVSIRFNLPAKPAFCLDVLGGQEVELQAMDGGWGIKNVQLVGHGQRAYLTPRGQIERSSLDWFTLQRNWWRGTTPPRKEAPLPVYDENTLDLNQQWAFLPLDGQADAVPLAATGYDDAKWERMPLGIWDFPDHHDVKRAMYRKTFTIPPTWKNGTIYFWMQAVSGDPIVGTGQLYLDGQPLTEGRRNGGYELTARLAPGSRHTLALDIRTTETLGGVRGNAWFSYFPAPVSKIDLAGTWAVSADGLTYGEQVTLPGPWKEWRAARRKIKIPAELAGQSIYIQYEGMNTLVGVLVNGTYQRRHHHGIGGITRLNITPYLRVGEENEIEIVGNGGKGDLTAAALWVYAGPK